MRISNRITAVIAAVAVMFIMAACSDDKTTDSSGETKAATVPAEEASNADGQQTQSGSVPGGNGTDIGQQQVQAIVLAKVPGATEADITELEREEDDGRIEYDGTVYYNGYEYEFKIDGATGNILEWEIDD